jgi:aminoglycoside phosphotransferase family enzyme
VGHETPFALAERLREPDVYRHDVEDVGFRQTHISLLFFAGDRVYKVKKPVDLGFLDFSTLESRRHYCEEEVRLNQALALRSDPQYQQVIDRVARQNTWEARARQIMDAI